MKDGHTKNRKAVEGEGIKNERWIHKEQEGGRERRAGGQQERRTGK